MKVNAEEHPCLMTEIALNTKEAKEKIIQVMFETFNVPCFYLSMQSVLALYASGRTTGLVLDSGHGITHAVPVVDGYAHPMAVSKIKVAGKQVDQFLQDLLKKR
jgi:actin-related protein